MKLILFEGVDGSGKTTLATACYNKLLELGHRCMLVREPGGTEVGEEIRKILLNNKDLSPKTQLLLFFAAREEIYNYLDEDFDFEYVLFDRSHYSSYAMQALTPELMDIYDLLLNKKYNNLEELIVFCNISPTRLNKEYEDNAFECKGIEFQEKIYENYKKIFGLKDNVLSLPDMNLQEDMDMVIKRLGEIDYGKSIK